MPESQPAVCRIWLPRTGKHREDLLRPGERMKPTPSRRCDPDRSDGLSCTGFHRLAITGKLCSTQDGRRENKCLDFLGRSCAEGTRFQMTATAGYCRGHATPRSGSQRANRRVLVVEGLNRAGTAGAYEGVQSSDRLTLTRTPGVATPLADGRAARGRRTRPLVGTALRPTYQRLSS